MAQKLGNGQNTERETDIAVVAPSNIGKGIKWNPETGQYEVAIKANEPIKINDDGELEIVISPDKYNDIEKRKNGLYLGSVPPADTSNLYVSSSQGDDSNAGTREAPLRTINEAFKRNKPKQSFNIHLLESDRHEWRTSWGAKNNYVYNVFPYGSTFDSVKERGAVNSNDLYRSKEIKRPTIEFVFDDEKYGQLQTIVQNIFVQACAFYSTRLTQRTEATFTSKPNGVFGGGASGPNLRFVGCEIDLDAPQYYLQIGRPDGAVTLDHTKLTGSGSLGKVESAGLLTLGVYADHYTDGQAQTGNTKGGLPTDLTFNGATARAEVITKFTGKTTAQQVGIIY